MTTLGSSPTTLAIDAVVADLLSTATTTRWVAPFDAAEVATSTSWTTTAQESGPARLRYRNGDPVGGSSAMRFDYGSTSAQTLLAESVYQTLDAAGFVGWSLGTVLDSAELGYDPLTAADREHVPHGGTYRARGIRAMLDSLPAGPRIADHPQEFSAHLLDLAQDFETHYPRHLEMAEETLLALDVLDVPAAARDMSPPLWAIVYGDRSQVGALLPPLTTIGRTDSLYHPVGAWTGLTATQWNQVLAWQVCSGVVHGVVPILQTPTAYSAHRVQPDTAEPIADLINSAQAFLRGALVMFSGGAMPLPAGRECTDECSQECGAGPDTATNPVYYVRQVSRAVAADVVPPRVGVYSAGPECGDECSEECSVFDATPTTGWGAAHQSFPVQSVVHAVRRDPETGDLCLVLANWTSAAAAWSGWFLPWVYGQDFGGEVAQECGDECDLVGTVDVASLDSTGSATTVATGLTDATLLTCSGISGTITGRQLSLGSVPAYSIQAYRIRATA